MFFNVAITALTLSAPLISAFTPDALNAGSHLSPLRSTVAKNTVQTEPVTVEPVSNTPDVSPKLEKMLKAIGENERIKPGRYAESENSIAIPFLKRPAKLDGTHAGDYGFDPLGLTEIYDLYTMQEAELRHGRLAMLAVLGWPLSELLAPSWMLQGEHGCAPSVLNGFNPLSFLATVAFFGAAGYFEYKTALRKVDDKELGLKHFEDMADTWDMGVAGDYNFDPLGLYSKLGDDAYGRKGLRDVEISHGRSAMLGITSFAIWEFLTGHPIVENSMFFHPNLLLPALVGGYVFASSIYEVDVVNNQKIEVRMTSEGAARLSNIKLEFSNAKKSAGINKESISSGVEVTKEVLSKAVELAKQGKRKYESMSEAYTDYSMRNYESKP